MKDNPKKLKEYDFSRFFCYVAVVISLIITCIFLVENSKLRKKIIAQEMSSKNKVEVDSEFVPEFQRARQVVQYFENENDPQTDRFFNVNPNQSDRKVLVYSAYWDRRRKPGCVRLITIMVYQDPPLTHCAFKTGTRSK